MTYCLGILLPGALVLASDSRSNAGVDQVQQVCKLATFVTPGRRVIAVLSQGNLATTQAVVTGLREAEGDGVTGQDLDQARSMFEVATLVGAKLREVLARDAKSVEPYGDPNASFLVGGQIAGEPPRLFEIYSAGNFVEASSRANFLQIGETKYGKPILDRALAWTLTPEHAAKLALLSFDATLRSNVSVGLPIDLLRYKADSFTADVVTIEAGNPYWRALRDAYSAGLGALVDSLPAPPADLR
ncbi:MAG TPA: peptidase [Caulobacteraceae bacterium]|jgi:putative proteasome-type protease